MAEKWSTVQTSDSFQALSAEEQGQVKQRYFDNVISKDAGFQALDDAGKQQVTQRFIATATPQQQDKAARVDMSSHLDLVKKSTPRLISRPGLDPTGTAQIDFARRLREQEQTEAQATEAFMALGGNPEQLSIAQDILKKVESPPSLGRSVGATIGSIALPAAVNLIPGMAALPEEMVTIPLAAALFGAGTGGALGEATQVGIQERRMASRQEMVGAFTKEVGFELGGRGLAKGAKFALSPFIKNTIPEAAAIAEDFAKFGGVLPPSELDKRFHLSLVDEIARGGIGAKQAAREFTEKKIDASGAMTESIMDSMARGFGQRGKLELGEEFAAGITKPDGKIFNTMDEIFTPLYTKIDDLTRGAETDVLTKAAKTFNILDEFGNPIKGNVLKIVKERPLEGTVSIDKLVKYASDQITNDERLANNILSTEGRSRLKRIVKLGKISDGRLNLKDLRSLRSSLLKERTKLARDGDISDGVVKQLSNLTNDALFNPDQASGFTGEARTLLQNTNRLYKSAMEAMDTTFSEKLLKRLESNPSSVLKEVFPVNNPKAIKNLRNALVEPVSGKPSVEGQRLFTRLRTAWVADAVEKSTKDGIPNHASLENALKSMKPEAIAEMFPDIEGKRQLKNLKSLVKIMGSKGGNSSLFVRGGQATGAVMMYQGTKEGDSLQVAAGGALLAGPIFLARLASSKVGNALLRAGVSVPKGSSRLAPIAARMINITNQMKSQEQKRSLQAEQSLVRGRESKKQIQRAKAVRARQQQEQPFRIR